MLFRSKWLFLDDFRAIDDDFILIHRSNRRINPSYNYEKIIKENKNVSFLVCNNTDLYLDGYKIFRPSNIKEMAVIISKSNLFIGNQSAPLALASSLDVPRLAVLDLDFNNYIFYENESKYSNNIKCFI